MLYSGIIASRFVILSMTHSDKRKNNINITQRLNFGKGALLP